MRLKRSDPCPEEGIGPLIKTDFPVSFKTFKRILKSLLVRSDSRRQVSFVPTCSTIREMEAGSEGSKFRNLSRITGTVAPGKQRVIALKKWMSLVIESPMINVVGGMRGRGSEVCKLPGLGSGRSVCDEDSCLGSRVCAGGQE